MYKEEENFNKEKRGWVDMRVVDKNTSESTLKEVPRSPE